MHDTDEQVKQARPDYARKKIVPFSTTLWLFNFLLPSSLGYFVVVVLPLL